MAINTYFQNIANAIRTKTGSAGLITPAEMPDEILNIPAGGSGFDLSNVTYIGFFIVSQRSYDTYIQIAKLQFLNANDEIIPFSLNATYGVRGGNSLESGGEGAYAMWNNDLNIGNFKTIFSKTYVPNICWVQFNTPQDFSNVKKYRWYTAGDIPARDPVTFGLLMGNDSQTDGLLKVFDYMANANITTERNTIAYTKEIL